MLDHNKKNTRKIVMLKFYIKTHNPKSHIEACSFISFFGAEILYDEICEKGSEYYGIFHVNGTPDFFETISEFPGEITIQIPQEKLLR